MVWYGDVDEDYDDSMAMIDDQSLCISDIINLLYFDCFGRGLESGFSVSICDLSSSLEKERKVGSKDLSVLLLLLGLLPELQSDWKREEEGEVREKEDKVQSSVKGCESSVRFW